MLRFDLPQVPANVIRCEAFVVTSLSVLALFISPWIMIILVTQGLLEGFWGHMKCPSHVFWRKIFVANGWQGRMENAGPKMFAAKILFLAASVALGLYLAGSTLWTVPVIVLTVFSSLEWAFSFCAACWVYGIWYQRFPSGG